jgi:hypothetical protein
MAHIPFSSHDDALHESINTADSMQHLPTGISLSVSFKLVWKRKESGQAAEVSVYNSGLPTYPAIL